MRAPLSMLLFATAALAPVALIGVAAVEGGAWVWAGLAYMGALAVVLDRLVPLVAGDASEGAEFPGSDALLVAVGGLALVMLPLVTWAVAGPTDLAAGERVALALATGFWLGQVAHPAAHELIHRPGRGLFRLGVAVYVALLFGQHASAHRLVHHRHVATDDDPNSARPGEGFWRFALRAWTGSFVEGWRAEDVRRARSGGADDLRRRSWGRRVHPYAVYLGGAAVALALAAALAGPAGVAVWAGMAGHAQLQLLVSDYVQHYGLRRGTGADGRPEPVDLRHSWNGGEWFSSALMLNAPRHSDHHAHPARPYPHLRLPAAEAAPRLPWPLPVACTIAFFPRLWRRAMRPHLARWRDAGKA